MKMNTKQTTWHWPDHVIGKRESRRLREEHNALANSHAELSSSLSAMLSVFNVKRGEIEPIAAFICIEKSRAALDQAKEVGHDS